MKGAIDITPRLFNQIIHNFCKTEVGLAKQPMKAESNTLVRISTSVLHPYHTWKEKFKMPFETVVVGNVTILPTSTLMVRVV